MIEYTYNSDEIDRLFKAFPEAVRAASVSKVTEALMYLERIIKQTTPYGAGPVHMIQTISTEVNASGDTIEGMVGTLAKYGEPVEFGTKPHFPPIEPIKYWVEKKLGIGPEESGSVAFLIARKIAQKGTEGAYMFTNAWEDNQSAITAILDQIPDEALRRVQ